MPRRRSSPTCCAPCATAALPSWSSSTICRWSWMSPIRSSSSILAASSPAARRATSSAIRASSRPISASRPERPDGRGVMLEISFLHTGYGDVGVLHGVDLTVGAGEIVALIGANGAGKTTLAKAISGLLPVRRGEIPFFRNHLDPLAPLLPLLLLTSPLAPARRSTSCVYT